MTKTRLRVWLLLLLLLLGGASSLFLPTIASFSVHEAGDLAADMLQADVAARSGWWVFGHHSDVGARHPGPAGLLLKHAFSYLASAGLFESVFGSSVAALVLLRVLLLLAVLFFLARASGSLFASALFVLPLLLLIPHAPIGVAGAWLHFPVSHVAFALVAGWVAFALDRDAPPLLLLLASGLGVHLHATLFPVALPLLVLAAAATFRLALLGRWRESVVPGFLAALFSVPLALRVFVESSSSWPLSYLEAARARSAAQSMAQYPDRSQFFFLEGYSGLPGDFAATLILAVAAASVCLLLFDTRRRLLWSGVSWLFVAASVTLLLSDQQQLIASEMLWVAGMPAAAAGILLAGLFLLSVRASSSLRSRLPSAAAAAVAAVARLSPLFAALLLFPLGSLPASVLEEADAQGGLISDYIPTAADVFFSSGATALQLSREGFIPAEAGIALELRRRGVSFCVQPAPGSSREFVQEMAWFFLPEDVCASHPSDVVPPSDTATRMVAVKNVTSSTAMLSFDAGWSFAPLRLALVPVCFPGGYPESADHEAGGLWDGC